MGVGFKHAEQASRGVFFTDYKTLNSTTLKDVFVHVYLLQSSGVFYGVERGWVPE